MNYNKHVLVDMDGVIADFNGRATWELMQEQPAVPIPAQQEHFYLNDHLPEEAKVIFRAIISRPGFFLDLPVIDGAVDGWAKLLEAGYTLQICTAPLRKNPTCEQDKLAWLEQHFVPAFGYWVIDTAIIDKDKARHPGVALIDDRPVVKGYDTATWTHIVYTQDYNRHIDTSNRMDSWDDTRLLGVLAELSREGTTA